MGNLFKYSSLTTKIRSMSSDLISIEGFKTLSECRSITDAVNELMYLKTLISMHCIERISSKYYC